MIFLSSVTINMAFLLSLSKSAMVTNVLASVEINKSENWHYLQFSNGLFRLTCRFGTTSMGLLSMSFGHMGPLVILKFEYTGVMIISMLDFNGFQRCQNLFRTTHISILCMSTDMLS